MALIIKAGPAGDELWRASLQALLPDIECRVWDAAGDPDDIEIAVVWKPPAGGLKRFSRLRCIISPAAGIDHLLADPDLPAGVPIIRTTGADLTQRMVDFVTLLVLRFHRHLPELEAAKAEGAWRRIIGPPANQRRVGIMGLGRLGGACATALTGLGFEVAGWSRGGRTVKGVRTFAGQPQLQPFLQRSEILVCLLPLTPETLNILNHRLFAALPRGACLINVARGEHLDERDLLDALAEGQLAGAALDVFRQEPLPGDHPFWAHPKVLVTPHVASVTDAKTAAPLIAANIRRFLQGDPLPDLADRARGY